MAKITKLEKEMAKMLSEDLISEIIVKLPVKTLLRCKCVCKAWYDLIKSPNFIDKHLKHNTTKTDRILFTHSPGEWTQLLSLHDYESLDLIDVLSMKIPRLNYHALEISGPCNGLLCLLDIQSELVLYNPAMREYKHLPARPLPSHYVLGFGFGFVSNPNDYKVVSFVSFKNELSFDDVEDDSESNSESNSELDSEDNDDSESDEDNAEDDDDENNVGDDDDSESDEDIAEDDDDENNVGDNDDDDSESDEEYIGDNIVEDNDDNVDHEAVVDNKDVELNIKLEVYNLSKNSWREIKCDCPDSIGDDQYGILFNGALHWTAYRKGKEIIISFDMNTEVLHDIELPSDLIGKLGIRKSLMVLNDCLALFAYTYTYRNYGNSEEKFVDIWVMKDYGVVESWTKQFSAGPLSSIYRPLMLWKNKTILLESTDGTLILWDLDTQEIDESVKHVVEGLKRVMVFQESLISLV